MVKPSFHLHLDAAYLPAPLLDRMIEVGGFHLDDFPHELIVKGEAVPARHLTKYLYSPTTAAEAKAECLRLKDWAQEFNFQGLIQCEYVMEETEWKKEQEYQGEVAAPFSLRTRPLSSKRGDQFKKHEIHLEMSKPASSASVINALRECGLAVLENDHTITFTTNGHSKEMLALRRALKRFLKKHDTNITGKLTYEATAFWSLHDIESQHLPQIVDQVLLN